MSTPTDPREQITLLRMGIAYLRSALLDLSTAADNRHRRPDDAAARRRYLDVRERALEAIDPERRVRPANDD